MYDKSFIYVEDKELREEYLLHIKKLLAVVEISSVMSYYFSEYRHAVESNDIDLKEKYKSILLQLINSESSEISLDDAKEPSSSSRILSSIFYNTLFNFASFVIKNSKNENIKYTSADDEVLEILIDEDAEGEDPDVIFEMLYNNLVSKNKLKA